MFDEVSVDCDELIFVYMCVVELFYNMYFTQRQPTLLIFQQFFSF